jgi:glutamyl-tRNA synthetase
VYACDCTAEQVARRNRAAGRSPGYDGHCRDRGLAPDLGRLLRFRTPSTGTTSWTDVVRGEIRYENSSVEDFSVRKSNGQPLFILANVVDDADMAITHVVRGEDHVPNTPKHILLWEALELGPPPVFAHLPLLVNAARQKLSKRRDKVALEDYRDEGYLPEAMVNYLALLGWSPGNDREILTKDELVSEFRLDQVKSSPAFFDEKKLSDLNSEYLRSFSVSDFVEHTNHWLSARWAPVAPLVQERARTLGEVFSMVDFLVLPDVRLDPGDWAKVRRQQPAFMALLEAASAAYEECEWEASSIREATVAAGGSVGITALAKAQAPIRLAVTGRTVGPPLFESLQQLGRRRTVARLAAARERVAGEQATGAEVF